MLESILQNCKPNTWENASYASQRYKLFDVPNSDDEYEMEISAFGNDDISVRTLQRVQNPYQLGQFRIRHEQKLFRNDHDEVVKFYHPIARIDLDTALEYNMDVRKYVKKFYGQTEDDKNPKFYKNPRNAVSVLSTASIISADDKIILICNVLDNNYNPSTYKTNSAEYMPIYVAAVN